MGLKLYTVLDKSGKLERILDLTYDDDSFSTLITERNIDEDEKDPNKKSPYHIDDHECINFKASYGLVSGANKISFA